MRPLLLTIAICISFSTLLFAADPAAPVVEPDAALARLKAGNARFALHPDSGSKPTRLRRLETEEAQHPFAVIVGCSDSRTPPEIVFDQNIGDLFVIRTAGNLVDDYGLGTIEYAVEHLGARLIVVIGHEKCGAVRAAIASGDAPGHIGNLVRDIRPAVEAVRAQPGDPVVNGTKSNIDRVAAKIREKAQFGSLGSSVRVVEAYYHFEDGKVEWLDK